MPRVLCVAEKPSIARAITEILSGGHYTTVRIFIVLPAVGVVALTWCHSKSEMDPASTTKTLTSLILKPTLITP